MGEVRAILLDVDDTLVAESDAARMAVAATASLILGQSPAATNTAKDLARRYVEISDLAWSEFTDDYLQTTTNQAIRESLWTSALRSLGISIPAHDLSLAVSAYSRFKARHFTRDRGLIDAMTLAREAVRFVVCSNSSETEAKEKLHRAGVVELVSAWVCGRDLGVRKPATEIFEQSLVAGGSSPEHSVMIGDDLELDILPAESLGMSTRWVGASGRDDSAHDGRLRYPTAAEAILSSIGAASAAECRE